MEIVKFFNGDYHDLEFLADRLQYVMNPFKTNGYFGSICVNAEDAYAQMIYVKQFYQKINGRQFIHFSVSLEKFNDMDLNKVWNIAYDIGMWFGEKYQVVFGIHQDTDNIHIHYIVNSVSYKDGRKLTMELNDLERFKKYVISIKEHLATRSTKGEVV